MGRMVNDSPRQKANSTMKRIAVKGRTYLCLFAVKDLEENTELRYEYGLTDLPWRKQGRNFNMLCVTCALNMFVLTCSHS